MEIVEVRIHDEKIPPATRTLTHVEFANLVEVVVETKNPFLRELIARFENMVGSPKR